VPFNILSRYLRKAYTSFATHVYDIPPRMLAFLILIILAAAPYGGLDTLRMSMLTYANLMAILALSWDLLVGRTGQISLGHALFFASGGYATALLSKNFGWPLWVTIPLSVLATTAIALFVGIPCLRVKGPYLALVTMSLPLAFTGFIYYFPNIFGGDRGISGLPTVFPMLSFLQRYVANYYLSLALMCISAILIYKIANSKIGMVFVSILDDELGAKASGINVTKYKLLAFSISGLFAGLAGSFYAHITGSATPSLFFITTSFLPLIATILGGIGTIYGSLVGTYIYYFLDRYVFQYVVPLDDSTRVLIFITVVIILLIKWPRGIGRTIVEKLEDLEEPREIEEIERERAKKGEKS
jgi:branched-chain amino acid transport system permease protein